MIVPHPNAAVFFFSLVSSYTFLAGAAIECKIIYLERLMHGMKTKLSGFVEKNCYFCYELHQNYQVKMCDLAVFHAANFPCCIHTLLAFNLELKLGGNLQSKLMNFQDTTFLVMSLFVNNNLPPPGLQMCNN